MEDQYGLTPEDYVDDMKFLSIKRYGQGTLFLILLEETAEAFPSHCWYIDGI